MKWAALLLVLCGCLEVERIALEIDLEHHTATLQFYNIGGSDPRADPAYLDGAVVPNADNRVDTQLARFGVQWVTLFGWPRVVERTTAGKTTLYGAVAVRWDHLYEVGLSSVDLEHPFRFCLPDGSGLRIAGSDAVARDGHGCVIWGAGAKTLHVEMVPTAQRHDPQPFVRAWRAMHE